MGVSSRDCRILFSSHTKKRVPWRRKWQPTPVPLLGKSHGESSVQPSMEYNRAGHGLAAKKQMAVLANVWEQTLVRNWGLGLKPTSCCLQMWMLFRKTKINCKQIFEKKIKNKKHWPNFGSFTHGWFYNTMNWSLENIGSLNYADVPSVKHISFYNIRANCIH